MRPPHPHMQKVRGNQRNYYFISTISAIRRVNKQLINAEIVGLSEYWACVHML